MKKTQPNLFSIHSRRDGSYYLLSITVLEPKVWTTDEHQQLLELRWQSNRETPGEWYGIHVTFESGSNDNDLATRLGRASKLAARILPDRDSYTPGAIIERLNALGIFRAAYDGRVSRYVLESEKIDPTFNRWLDDWTAYPSKRPDGCTMGCLAPSVEAAKCALTKEWSKAIGRNTDYAEQFAAWVQAGKPVRRAYRDDPPEYQPIGDLLHLPQLAVAA